MHRRPDEPELMGAHEAAQTLGVLQTNLRTVSGLPAPYDKIAATTLWRAQDIRALAWERMRRRALKNDSTKGETETDANAEPLLPADAA